MPHDVAGGVRGPLTGRQTLTSLCPQGVPGASGLKGDKVEGAGLPAPSCTPHPVVPSAPPPDLPRPSVAHRFPWLTAGVLLLSRESLEQGRPGPAASVGSQASGYVVLLCSHSPLRGTTSGLPLLQMSPLNPPSQSINLILPSRVKTATLARRAPEGSW